MATAFTRDYIQFNPDASLGPNTWVLNSAGVNPGSSGGGGTAPGADPTPLDIHDLNQFKGSGAQGDPIEVKLLDEGTF